MIQTYGVSQCVGVNSSQTIVNELLTIGGKPVFWLYFAVSPQ